MSYVVAFNTARDFYQVPLALHEKGLLERLVTDVYYSDHALARRMPWMRRFRHRHIDGLPSALTTSDWYATTLEVLESCGFGQLLALSHCKVFDIVDDHLSRMALKVAERTDADLFLYSGFAHGAFSRSAGRRKGLFVYHPHYRLVRELLEADYTKHPECLWSMREERETAQSPENLEKFDQELELADFVVCASSFTKRSLLHMGCPEDKISVVPYGTDVTRPYREKRGGVCRFLFIGQGIQRKGLHHLLGVWRSLRCRDAVLTIIAHAADPEITSNLPDGVELLPRQPLEALYDHYAQSHIFVMPSLVEGFGHVYLEALATGCFVIGTESSGLPDLHAPPWAVAYTAPGDLDGLASIMQAAYARHRDGTIPHAEIRSYAESHLRWQSFRGKIASIAARMSLRSSDERDSALVANEA
jgi:glycosyltransferase involved in cell wall biosynthesis